MKKVRLEVQDNETALVMRVDDVELLCELAVRGAAQNGTLDDGFMVAFTAVQALLGQLPEGARQKVETACVYALKDAIPEVGTPSVLPTH